MTEKFMQVFLVGVEKFHDEGHGDQTFRVSIDGVIELYRFKYGEWVDVNRYVNRIRFELNRAHYESDTATYD
jgi:hypothetical protein